MFEKVENCTIFPKNKTQFHSVHLTNVKLFDQKVIGM